MATTIADDELHVTSSNSYHAIIGTLSKRVAYVGPQFEGWFCWQLFTGLEGITVVSRGSTVQFPDQGTRLFKVACFLTPSDGSNTLRLTIAECGGEYFIGGFVVGQELAMEVVSLEAVSGLQPRQMYKFMAKNKSVRTIKRHRKEQSNPEMEEFEKNHRARLPHVHGHFINHPHVHEEARVESLRKSSQLAEEARVAEVASLAEEIQHAETQHGNGPS